MHLKGLLQKLLLLVASCVAAILISEAILRVYKPYDTFDTGKELGWIRNHPRDLSQVFTIDPDFGFRPRLGNDRYSEFGTRRNDYSLEKRAGVTRILFIGDSVTARGKIIRALKRQYGEHEFEYWNGGVEAFNTVQELAFYKRFNAGASPDHVVLTFHLNDFETTPIAFMSDDKLVVYAPNMPSRRIDPRLFEYSYIYRLLLGLIFSEKKDQKAEIVEETEAAIAELKELLAKSDIEFTVLVLPFMKPVETWSEEERRSRDLIVSILDRLGIRYFDLLGILESAIEEGLPVQHKQGDFWHPNREISDRFAESLRAQDIF